MAAVGLWRSRGLHKRQDEHHDGKRDDVSQDAQHAVRQDEREEEGRFDEDGRRALQPDNECSPRVGRTGAPRRGE
jgi:hypothetical protein